MADWKKNRQMFQMPHDRMERYMRYVKAVKKQSGRLRKRKGPQRDQSLRKERPQRDRSLRKERPSSRRCCSNGGRLGKRLKKQEGGHAEI